MLACQDSERDDEDEKEDVLQAYEDFLRFCEDALVKILKFYGKFYDGIYNHPRYFVNDANIDDHVRASAPTSSSTVREGGGNEQK